MQTRTRLRFSGRGARSAAAAATAFLLTVLTPLSSLAYSPAQGGSSTRETNALAKAAVTAAANQTTAGLTTDAAGKPTAGTIEKLRKNIKLSATDEQYDIENGVLVAFEDENATSFTIPSNVTAIGTAAFSGMDKLRSITIPTSVKVIGNDAFYGTGLRSITIPKSVTSIRSDAFEGCSSLTAINADSANPAYSSAGGVLFDRAKTRLLCYPAGIPDDTYTVPSSVTEIGDWAFEDSQLIKITLPSGLKAIDDGAFYNDSYLEYINLPGALRTIGDTAFFQCEALASLTVPSSVTSLGRGAFESCTMLGSITFANGLVSIGDGAFSGCAALTNVTLPKTVSFIGPLAFENCEGLTSFSVDASNSAYSAVGGVLMNKAATELICYPAAKTAASYTIPSTVKKIDTEAFEWCENLTTVVIPSSVTSLGDFAFEGTGLTQVTIPGSVTDFGLDVFNQCTDLAAVTASSGLQRIGDEAFTGCTALTSVSLPSGLQTLGLSAFNGCEALASVTIPNSVYEIGEDCFTDTPWLAAQTADFAIVGNHVLLKYNGTATNVTIPDGVLSIAGGAFGNYEDLLAAILPSGDGSGAVGTSTSTATEEAGSGDGSDTGTDDPYTPPDPNVVNIQSVSVPASVTFIEPEALGYMGKLQSITVASGNTLFSAANGVLFYGAASSRTLFQYPVGKTGSSYAIPSGVSAVGTDAFAFSGVESVTIPSSVKAIDTGAFAMCGGLTSANLPSGLQAIGDSAFTGTLLTSVTVPASVTQLGGGAFAGCSDLTSATLQTTADVSAMMFTDCTKLTNVTLADGTSSIGTGAFGDCESLTSVTLPRSLTSIDESAFAYCDLTNVFVPQQTSVGYGAFWANDRLTLSGISGSPVQMTALREGIPFTAVAIQTVMGHLDSPANATYNGRIQVAGWAVSCNGLAREDIYVDNNRWVGSTSTYTARADVQKNVNQSGLYVNENNGFGYTIPAGFLSAGKHTLKVASIDRRGNASWTTSTFTVGTQAIITSCVDSPRNTAYYGGIAVAGWTVACNGVSRVDIYVDNNRWVGSTNSFTARPDVQRAVNGNGYYAKENNGFSYTIPSGFLAAGKHTLKLAAIDKQGHAQWTTSSFSVGAAKTCIDTPRGGATVSGAFSVAGWAVAPSGIQRVDIYADVGGHQVSLGSVAASALTARADVQRAVFPNGIYPTGNRCGFNLNVASGKLSKGVHTICVASIGNDGKVQWTTVKITVK